MTDELKTAYYETQGANPFRIKQEGGVILEKRETNEKTGDVLRVGHKAKYPTIFHYYEALKHLSAAQREAGCWMAAKYYIAGRVPNMPIPWVKANVGRGSVTGYNPSDAKMDAEDELRRIEKQLLPREAVFIRNACLYNEGVGGENPRAVVKRIAIMGHGLRIIQHLLQIPEEG
jgi:hypothetical protein